MRIVVVGPGAVGCLLAALLTESGEDVCLLDKDAPRARAIGETGVRVDSESGSRTVRIPTLTDPTALGLADVVCLCVKACDTTAAIRRALPFVGSGTTVCSFQNGLGNGEWIARNVDAAQIVCAATAHGSTHLAAGHIRHAGTGPTLLAPWIPGGMRRAEDLLPVLNRAGMETGLESDRDRLLWSKLILNAAINPVTALADVPNGGILERTDLRDRAFAAAREAARVAEARGIQLLYPDACAEVENVCRRTAMNLSSMLQDVRRGRRTEIEAINGAIVREARSLSLPVPVNAGLVAAVRSKNQSDASNASSPSRIEYRGL